MSSSMVDIQLCYLFVFNDIENKNSFYQSPSRKIYKNTAKVIKSKSKEPQHRMLSKVNGTFNNSSSKKM
jgi:hypothetical protein